jgi:hypothetical protein
MANWAFRRLVQESFVPKRFFTSPALKASSFTGKAQFYEALFFLDDVYLKVM